MLEAFFDLVRRLFCCIALPRHRREPSVENPYYEPCESDRKTDDELRQEHEQRLKRHQEDIEKAKSVLDRVHREREERLKMEEERMQAARKDREAQEFAHKQKLKQQEEEHKEAVRLLKEEAAQIQQEAEKQSKLYDAELHAFFKHQAEREAERQEERLRQRRSAAQLEHAGMKEFVNFSPLAADSLTLPSVLASQAGEMMTLSMSEAPTSPIPEKYVQISVGVIGQLRSGRSHLVGALAGGQWPDTLANPAHAGEEVLVFKFSYPKLDSTETHNDRFEAFFQASRLSQLSALLVTSHGSLRQEDLLMLDLAHRHGVPVAIVRTCLDSSIDNLPKSRRIEPNVQGDYVREDKEFIRRAWAEYANEVPYPTVFSVSALAVIIGQQDPTDAEMARYRQDEVPLRRFVGLAPLHLAAPGSPVALSPEVLSAVDVAVMGQQFAGKSALAHALQALLLGVTADEFRFSALEPLSHLTRMVSRIHAKLFVLVVPHVLQKTDVQLVHHWHSEGVPFVVALSRSDEHLDNLAKQTRVSLAEVDKNAFRLQRHEAANTELAQAGLSPPAVPCFTVSCFVLDRMSRHEAVHTYSTEEEVFVEFVKKHLQ